MELTSRIIGAKAVLLTLPSGLYILYDTESAAFQSDNVYYVHLAFMWGIFMTFFQFPLEVLASLGYFRDSTHLFVACEALFEYALAVEAFYNRYHGKVWYQGNMYLSMALGYALLLSMCYHHESRRCQKLKQ